MRDQLGDVGIVFDDENAGHEGFDDSSSQLSAFSL
jgi:hypothetical protein